MQSEYEKLKQKQKASMKAVREYGMGVVILLLGLFFFFRGHFKLDMNANYPPDLTDTWFGAICLIYGGWRIYRGFQSQRNH